jgi:anti-sigma regulatory factor (Ser/Thr protein kinase)
MRLLLNIKLPAKLENLGSWMEAVSECAKEQGFDQKKIGKIELALEEALVNICKYSYPDDPGDAEVNCKQDNGRFIIEIVDSGIPFDMTSLPAPDVTSSIEKRKIGGLGIFLIKKMVDEVRYRREGNFNILKLTIKRDEEK